MRFLSNPRWSPHIPLSSDKVSAIIFPSGWTCQVPGLCIFTAMNLTPHSLLKEDRKCWRKYAGKAHMLQCVYAEQELWNVVCQQIRHPCSSFYIYRVLGMIKSRENYARGGNEFPISSPTLSGPVSLASEISSPLPIKTNRICASLLLLWTGARGKSESRAMRDWNMLVHTSELFGWKGKLKGGEILPCGKPSTL